jgi:hypothetical protein
MTAMKNSNLSTENWGAVDCSGLAGVVRVVEEEARHSREGGNPGGEPRLRRLDSFSALMRVTLDSRFRGNDELLDQLAL